MLINDPIGDMLTRIRNGLQAGKSSVTAPASQARQNVLSVLKSEGYIRDYSVVELRPGIAQIKIELKYRDGKAVISEIKRVSRPGRRIFSSVKDLPRVYNGLGTAILSTSRGVVSDAQARTDNIGGEILCTVF